tara:strand:- start:1381 stop:2583 length:1203 start_codon:yes stop_codon:yes gene_type:complete
LKTSLLELTRSLIEQDTVSAHGTGKIADFVANELSDFGFKTRLHETTVEGVRQTNVIAWVGPAEPDGLIISGHLDTVPFQGQPGWNSDPLELVTADGRVVGRGVTDMKGFVAQCLVAARDIRPESLTSPLVFIYTCLEEVGCLGARGLAPVLPSLIPEIPIPKLAWIGEPTDYEVFHAHKGVVDFEIVVHGQGGHSSLPDKGVNAITVAGKVLERIDSVQKAHIRKSRREDERLFSDAPFATFNVGSIKGGTASNMIPEECRIRLSYRPLPGTDPLGPYLEITKGLEALDLHDAAGGSSIAEVSFGTPLVVAGLNSPTGTTLEKALRRNAKVGRSGLPFCTDGGAFETAGITSLICGPGELSQAHQPNESISRTSLENGPDFIRDVLRKLCGAVFRESRT